MKYFKKTAALVLAVLCLMSGCRKKQELTSSFDRLGVTSAASSRNYITLLYSSSDTFNPYTAVTDINRQLCRLMYEPLVKTDNDFNAVNCLAESVTLNGKTCTVALKNALFSDGSAVTADDVVYSFNAAKGSATEYAYKLYGAVSAAASGSKTVVFNLAKADPYFVNLIDFPIVKKGSEARADEDGKALPPIGAGRYVSDDGMTKLTANTKYYGGSLNINEIRLINAPDSESVSHYVEVGAADMYYSDISDGNIVRMSGKKVSINLNRIVFIGVNKAYGELANAELRQAISSGIDRKAICRDGYYNNALAANGFFNPKWQPVKSVQSIETTANKEITIENLEKIGYNSVDANGIRKNSGGQRLEFELLVNSENRVRVFAAQLIANQLFEYGIKIRIAEKSFADYTAALASGNFQLYLGEVAITPNMDLTNLVAEGGSAAYGAAASKPDVTADTASDTASDAPTEETAQSVSSAELINGFYLGTNTVNDVASVLQAEMPFIPVCYRTGVLFYNDNIENVNNSSLSDIYFSIESYKIK